MHENEPKIDGAEITLTLRLFGGLRDHAPRGTLAVSVRRGATIADVRAALRGRLAGAAALIELSALATEREVLGADAVFDADAELAVLPPVCGG